jgi:H/ACA ribonucleoprotein complex subunit 4
MDLAEIRKNKTTEELLEFGIINIDKPSGPTSFDVSENVMKILGLRKTSHFGTLDPKVTGVLPIALNRACKLTGFFLGEDKEYVGVMRLHSEVPEENLNETIKKFIGKIMQRPPVKSRVARVIREREVKRFDVLETKGKEILFITEVQGGTYIRKLVHDLGEALGLGAHMLELRRIRAGIFQEIDSYTLYELEEAAKKQKEGDDKALREMVIPGEVISELFPIVKIDPESADRILHGQPVYEKNLIDKKRFEEGEKICVFSGDKFIGIFVVKNQDKIFAKADFVLQPIK